MLQVIEVQAGSAASGRGSGSTTAAATATAAAATGGGCGIGSLQRHSRVLRRQQAHLAYLVAPYLGHHNINDDFRLGFVDVVNHLLRQRKLVRSAANHDGIL